MQSLEIRTPSRHAMIDITASVSAALRATGVRRGLAVIFCPHTTAAITINENADPDVVHDLLLWYERQVPHEQPGFRHGEGNSDSHIKSTLVGPSVTVIVEDGGPVLGRWQGIFFCEFDGPRTRSVHVQAVGS